MISKANGISKMIDLAIKQFRLKQYDVVNLKLQELMHKLFESSHDDELTAGDQLAVLLGYNNLKILKWVIKHHDEKALKVLINNMDLAAKKHLLYAKGRRILELLEDKYTPDTMDLDGIIKMFFTLFLEADKSSATLQAKIYKNEKKQITQILQEAVKEFQISEKNKLKTVKIQHKRDFADEELDVGDKIPSRKMIKKNPKIQDSRIEEDEEVLEDKNVPGNGMLGNIPTVFKSFRQQHDNISQSWFPQSLLTYWSHGIDDILQLRIRGIDLSDNVQILRSTVFENKESPENTPLLNTRIPNIMKILLSGTASHILLPINLYGQHWVGVIFGFENDKFIASYLDSENQSAPEMLRFIIEQQLGFMLQEVILDQQCYENNCGPEMIENFALFLTGERVKQDETLTLHSHLVESQLLGEITLNEKSLTQTIDYCSTSEILPTYKNIIFFFFFYFIKKRLKEIKYKKMKKNLTTLIFILTILTISTGKTEEEIEICLDECPNKFNCNLS